MMISQLKAMFGAARKGGDPSPERTMSVALGALMIEAARADERVTEDEGRLIRRALIDGFDLTPADAEDLVSAATAAQRDAVDLHQFTKLAKTLPEADRIAFIETLWRIVLADGEKDPYEDAIIRRICALLYVADPESGAARRRVEAALGR